MKIHIEAVSSIGNCDRTVAKTSGIGNSHRQKTISQIAAVSDVGMTVVKTSGIGNSDRSVVKLTKSPSFVSMNTQLYHFLLPLPSVLFLIYSFFCFSFSFFFFLFFSFQYNTCKLRCTKINSPPIIVPLTHYLSPNGVKYHVLCTWGPSMQVTWSLLIKCLKCYIMTNDVIPICK